MKIKVLSRNEADFTKERTADRTKMFKSTDPKIHHFEKAREYTRAVNAVKWERIFAAPFVAALDGHMDGVYTMSTVPNSLVLMLSGAGDGEVRLWNISTRKCVWRVKAHDGMVRGVTVDTAGERVLSCSADKTIKMWNLHRPSDTAASSGMDDKDMTPVATFLGQNSFLSVVLYDVRQKTPVRKLVMQMSSNSMSWNPMEAFNFTVANEDTNCYTFDMRKLDIALNVHRDHVAAVMSVEYSPTGREFVTGSYDRTVRLFGIDAGHSREVYHTKRMQRIFSVRFSADNKYVLSGSDDTNIRLWKVTAHERIRTLLPREQSKRDYLEKLKERYKFHKQTARIARHRHIPKAIYNAKQKLRIIVNSKREKLRRVIAHSKPGSVPTPAARAAKIVKQFE